MMKRRTCLQTLLAAGLAPAAVTSGAPIQLHVDLHVDPAQEQKMLHTFRTVFRPAAARQPGFLDARMLKLRSAVQGAPPAGANFRFVLMFQSEELRQKWVATPTHQKVWPLIEQTLASKNYTVLLYDAA